MWPNLNSGTYDDADIDMPEFTLAPRIRTPFAPCDGRDRGASYIPLTEEEVRRARRAYLANVSYFDSKVGAIVQGLRDIGELDNTIVIVTADHGDMLGERGLWYKMNFLNIQPVFR